jgi:hypothetical protein
MALRCCCRQCSELIGCRLPNRVWIAALHPRSNFPWPYQLLTIGSATSGDTNRKADVSKVG